MQIKHYTTSNNNEELKESEHNNQEEEKTSGTALQNFKPLALHDFYNFNCWLVQSTEEYKVYVQEGSSKLYFEVPLNPDRCNEIKKPSVNICESSFFGN